MIHKANANKKKLSIHVKPIHKIKKNSNWKSSNGIKKIFPTDKRYNPLETCIFDVPK